MPDEIQIRNAVPGDAEAIAEIHVRSWREAYAGILPGDYLAGLSIENHRAFWERELAEGRTNTLVAAAVDTIIGWISGGPCRDADSPGSSEIHALYVSPEHWRNGSGRKLVEEMLRRFPPGKPTTLWVLERNLRGIGFYHRLGFAADGSSKIIRISGAELAEIHLRKEWTPQDIWERMAEP